MPSVKRIARELKEKDYLVGKTVVWKRVPPCSAEDRAFCVFCWEDLDASQPVRNEGFQEKESGDWICFPCLEKFLTPFDWQIVWPIPLSGTPPFIPA